MIEMLLALLFGFAQFVSVGEHVTYRVPETGEVFTLEFSSTDSWDIWHNCEITMYEGQGTDPVNLLGYVSMDTLMRPFIVEDKNDVPHPLPQISCLPNGGDPILSVISYTKELVDTEIDPIAFDYVVVLPVVFDSTPAEPPVIIDVQSQWLTVPVTTTLEVEDAQAVPSIP